MPVKIARSACSTIVRAARAAGSHPHLASVLLQGRKSANIYAVRESSGESRRNRRKNLLAFLPSIGARKLDRQSSTRGSRGRVLLAAAVYRRPLHSAVRGPFKPMH